MFIVQVHSDVHSPGSLLKFTSWFPLHVDPEVDPKVDPKVSRDHLLQDPRSGWFEGHHGRINIINQGINIEGIINSIFERII